MESEMQEKEWETAGGRLNYRMEGGKAYVTGYQGHGGQVEAPPWMDGCPTAGIEKKAFLSRKNLRRIVLPDTLVEVGDWAFAHCSGLLSASFPRRDIRFGRAVFKECERLERIEIRECEAGSEGERYGKYAAGSSTAERRAGAAGNEAEERGEHAAEGIPQLLAAAVRSMDAYYLLNLREAGSREWLAKWDARALAILHTPDQEGYSKQVLCGEEDYGSTDLEAFTSGRRREKVRLAFLRLLYPSGLSAACRAELEDYLRRHTKGREKEEAWLVLLEEHGDDREYYELFAKLGCMDENNFDEILLDIGDKYPELKAYFMRLREGWACAEDFFAKLEL